MQVSCLRTSASGFGAIPNPWGLQTMPAIISPTSFGSPIFPAAVPNPQMIHTVKHRVKMSSKVNAASWPAVDVGLRVCGVLGFRVYLGFRVWGLSRA